MVQALQAKVSSAVMESDRPRERSGIMGYLRSWSGQGWRNNLRAWVLGAAPW
jgi:hypothetical protein